MSCFDILPIFIYCSLNETNITQLGARFNTLITHNSLLEFICMLIILSPEIFRILLIAKDQVFDEVNNIFRNQCLA